jgi:hypothetical protein
MAGIGELDTSLVLPSIIHPDPEFAALLHGMERIAHEINE